jgi:hypothetical protein
MVEIVYDTKLFECLVAKYHSQGAQLIEVR